jgi:hypothetical protein
VQTGWSFLIPIGVHTLRKLDPVLGIALILALIFSIHGIQWGRVESWHPSEMALHPLYGIMRLRPGKYLKPPFHTILNHRVVLLPIEAGEHLYNLVHGGKVNLNKLRLVGSRLLTMGLFLGTIALAFAISQKAYGLFAARIIALLLATSAGFIVYDHFLSCDSPLLFWMTLSVFFAQRITTSEKASNYVFAGFFAGISTATKYNGLAVGIALVVAHLLKMPRWRELFVSRQLTTGLMMVPIGFLTGCPYALFDYRKFAADFLYNYKVTPHYGGQVAGHGYWQFLSRMVEILGLPGAILILLSVLTSLLIIVSACDFRRRDAVVFVLAASVFLLYFAKFGASPRMETRFVLPAVPFAILMAGPFFQTMALQGKWMYALMFPIFFYNSVCCFFVGKRFSEDPRMAAQFWIEKQIAPGSVIESSARSPHWKMLPGLKVAELDAAKPNWSKIEANDVIDLRMPRASGRSELFVKIFENDPWIRQHAKEYEGEADEQLFTLDSLEKRKPQVITVYSSDYKKVPTVSVRKYYSDLLEQKFPYDIVFDGESKEPPRWVYPRVIDHLRGRITILARRPGT